MPPVEPSIRGLLLTSASAVALSVSTAARAAPHASPTLTVWGEGSPFWTGGGSFNVPTIPGLTAPYTSFLPGVGVEGAVGFDYRWQSQPWHFIFDFRYGRSGNASGTSGSFHSTPAFGTLVSTTTTSNQDTEHETHLVADFMVGRDVGLGLAKSQLQFGVRIVDLYATASAANTGKHTYYSASTLHTVSQSTTGEWSSQFFGIGPRLAYVGSTPIKGPWSFEYGSGIALLFGNRTFDVSLSTGYSRHERAMTLVFNLDGWLALTYTLGPRYKISGGLRGDYYNAALTTYDINTGGLRSIDRVYWGPFVRLTAAF